MPSQKTKTRTEIITSTKYTNCRIAGIRNDAECVILNIHSINGEHSGLGQIKKKKNKCVSGNGS